MNNISFDIQKGMVTGFLGPNGAGKSTTMKMITGYLPADAGVVKVNGIAVKPDNPETRRMTGYLPESNPLYTDMYVREYLSFMGNLHNVSALKKRVEEVIELVGLQREAHKKVGQLSKGYKQRAGLAAALIHDPQVLILDEPTSGLDPNQILEIRRVIKEQAVDKTVLFSSHIMQEVEALCDRVIIINKGNIVADDSVANLRQGTGQTGVQVSFKENIALQALQSLNLGEVTAGSEGSFIITGKDTSAIKRTLLQYSMDKGLNISSLSEESRSLEDVFKNLTLN